MPRISLRAGLALALLAAAAAWALLGRGGSEEIAGYVTEPVDRGAIASTVIATGTVNPVTTVQVGTYVSGPIREIHVDFNSPVRKGQLVAKIDPAPFLVKVRQAEANLANARARLAKARADLELKRLTAERNRELVSRELISQSEFDAARSDFEQAVAQRALEQAGVQQAEAALEEARINLGYTEIVSPVDGVVVSRNVDVGQTVAASFQTPTLFQIAQDLTKMQVNTSVSESDIGAVEEGQPAVFTVDAHPDRTFQGTVVQVRNAPTVLQNVVTYDVVITVDNSGLELKPGMTATVTITTAQREDVVRVPLRALRFRPEEGADAAADGAGPRARSAASEAPAAFVLEAPRTLRRHELRLGVRDERFAEVLEGGLEPGMEVVVALRRKADAQEEPMRSPFAPRRMR